VATEQYLYPGADHAGPWQLLRPLPVNGSTYIEPQLIASATAAYALTDNAGAALNNDVLTLPAIGLVPANVQLVGVGGLSYVDTFATTWNVPLPTVAGGILANDFIEVLSATQESADPGALNTPTTGGTWSSRGSWILPATPWAPRITKWFRKATGGETGNIVVTGPSCRPHFVVKVWRGVHTTNPYDIALAKSWHGQGAQVNPAAVTTVTNGSVVTLDVAANIFPGGQPDINPPLLSSGYSYWFGNGANPRYFVVESKKRATAGEDDPSAWSLSPVPDNYTAVTDALRPAQGSQLTLLVLTAAADDVVTTAVSTQPLIAQSEIQVITSALASGTFTLSFNGQTTAAIAFNASAGTIQTALTALSSIGAGNVSVTSGPINSNPATVVFQGTLANLDVSLITASSPSVTVVETKKGHPVRTFQLEGTINIPPSAGSNYEPQVHIWSLTPPDYVPGATIDITVASHGGLHAWAAELLVLKGVSASNPVGDIFGGQISGNGAVSGSFGALTPVIPGAKALAVLGISGSGFYGPIPPSPGTPARYSIAARALSSAANLVSYLSPPLRSGVAETPSPVSWGLSQDFSTGIVEIRPAGSAGTFTGLSEANSSEDVGTWIELAPAAGSMYEVLEFNLASVPTDAWFLTARVDLAHYSTVSNSVRAVLCAIKPDGSIVLARDGGPEAFTPEPLGQVQIQTGSYVTTFADGSLLSDHDRLAVALISTDRHPLLTTHRIYWTRLLLGYEKGRPIITNLTGPATPGAPITWSYSSSTGLAQGSYEMMVIAGSNQNPLTATPALSALGATTGQIVYSSGLVSDQSARSLTITDQPLSRGACTVALRVWAQTDSGSLIPSEWVTANFDIAGVPPVVGSVDGAMRVEGHQVIQPDGRPLRRAGMNFSVPIYLPDGHPGKFGGTGAKVTAWADEGYSSSNGVVTSYQLMPDTQVGQWPKTIGGFAVTVGGFLTQYEAWQGDPTPGSFGASPIGWVTTPDKAAAMIGNLTTAAASRGVTMPPRNWGNPNIRIGALLRNIGTRTWIEGTDPNPIIPSNVTSQYIAQTRAHINLGFNVLLEDHSWQLAFNSVVPAALVANPMLAFASITAGVVKDSVEFYDAVVASWLTGGMNNMILGLPNEPYSAARSTNYDDLIVTLIRRIRGKGYTGIISWPTAHWSGDIGPVARGEYNTLFTRLQSFGVEGNLVMEEHLYGADWDAGGAGTTMTRANLRSYLTTLRDGVPGWGPVACIFTEYGRPMPNEAGAEGDKMISGVEILVGTGFGTPLVEEFPDICPIWWKGSGEHTFNRRMPVGRGYANLTNSAIDPNNFVSGAYSGTISVWDLMYLAPSALAQWLTPGGALHLAASDFLTGLSAGSSGGLLSFDVDTGLVKTNLLIPAGQTRAWLLRSADAGATWELSHPISVTAGATTSIPDPLAPMMRASLTYAISFDAGPMTETTIPFILGSVSTMITNWYLVCPRRPELSRRIEVAEVDIRHTVRSVQSRQPGNTIVATSRPLGDEIDLQIRARTTIEYQQLLELLQSGEQLRLIEVFGRETFTRVNGDIADKIQRWGPLEGGSQLHIQDAHVLSVSLAESRR
jgi:hypothetical protein